MLDLDRRVKAQISRGGLIQPRDMCFSEILPYERRTRNQVDLNQEVLPLLVPLLVPRREMLVFVSSGWKGRSAVSSSASGNMPALLVT